LILFVLATLGVTVVAFVLYPVFSEARDPEVGNTDANERELIALEEKKTRLYDAITDLDFEKEAAKVSDRDYETARNDYMAQVAETMTRIDALAPPRKKKKAVAVDSAVAAEARVPSPSLTCGSCGKPSREGSKFCMQCGAPFGLRCLECGASLPAEARFCMSCGHKVSA
jgi:ribosomal protein L40E